MISRRWSGYPRPQPRGGSSYSTELAQKTLPEVQGWMSGLAKPIVVLASARTKLPAGVLALQSAGRLAIVVEGPHALDSAIPQTTVDLPFGLVGIVRTHD